MKTLLSILFLVLITVACSTDPSQLPKNLPLVEENTDSSSNNSSIETAILQQIIQQHGTIATQLADGVITNYIVRDGEGLIAESTTYYTDEAKTMPCKTKIIYLTGDFADIYWLTDEFVWLEFDDLTHIFQKGNLLLSMKDGEATEVSDVDKARVSKIPTEALAMISVPISTEK